MKIIKKGYYYTPTAQEKQNIRDNKSLNVITCFFYGDKFELKEIPGIVLKVNPLVVFIDSEIFEMRRLGGDDDNRVFTNAVEETYRTI